MGKADRNGGPAPRRQHQDQPTQIPGSRQSASASLRHAEAAAKYSASDGSQFTPRFRLTSLSRWTGKSGHVEIFLMTPHGGCMLLFNTCATLQHATTCLDGRRFACGDVWIHPSLLMFGSAMCSW